MKHQKETYIASLLPSTGVCSQRWWFFVPNLLLGIGLEPQRRNWWPQLSSKNVPWSLSFPSLPRAKLLSLAFPSLPRGPWKT